MISENYKTVENKKVTSAVVIINKAGSILGCRVTGKNTYDFPKGCVDKDETDIKAAFRELYEETGVCIHNPEECGNVIDCGVYNHNKEKNIHIFLYKTEDFPDISQMKCISLFERDGKLFPEVNGYEIIPKNERYKFNRVLQDKFPIIDKTNETINEDC